VAPAANDAMLAALSQRLAAVEGMVARMAQLEAAVAGLQQSSACGPGAGEYQALLNQVRKLTAQVESLTKAAQATPGFGARNSFKCASCGAQGMVATVYRCTKCGKDKWLGFWPKPRR
jgi:DNA-directed RNA polymerase subunit RPC12/RpoP